MTALTAAEVAALHEALDDEYHAWTTYDQVITDFGDVRPFSNIREAEARHIEALLGLFYRYDLDAPPNRWAGRARRYGTLHEACADAVAAEIANAALYDRLMASTRRADLLAVFGNLREASQQRHLPAFRRCVARQA